MVTADYAKGLLALHGEVRPQPTRDWTGAFSLPLALKRFYEEVGPVNITIDAYGNPYFLPSLAGLWEFQIGYRSDGVSGEPVEDWSDNWLVVADEGGDPFIFERSTGAVLHAYHGEGEWDASEMFPDLNAMAACLAQLGAIVVDAGEAFTDDECRIRREFQDEALSRLHTLLGTASAAQAVLDSLGWGGE